MRDKDMTLAHNDSAMPRGARKTLRGQTLIIAVLVLGVLLIIGFAFAGIVSRNIQEAGRSQTRTVASDLAQGGLNFAHYQLVNSTLGADWRPELTPPGVDVGGFSRDPDAIYLRPGTFQTIQPDPSRAFTVVDRGGPDFRGPYSREFTERGRRLIRVRYAPFDFDVFASGVDSTLRNAGKAQRFIIIESIGRSGSLLTGGRLDPTRLMPEAIQVAGFANEAALRAGIARARAVDQNFNAETRRMYATASIGILESALFVTNKYKANRPAEIGFPAPGAGGGIDSAGVGAVFPVAGDLVPVATEGILGQTFAEPNNGRGSLWRTIPGLGGLYSNADLMVHGTIRAAVNSYLGENWAVSGRVMPANSASRLRFSRIDLNASLDQWVSGMNGFDASGAPYAIASTVNTPFDLNATLMNSDNPAFSTVQGVLRDGREGTDTEGFVRAVARKEPPSILALDPQSQRNRYFEMTRNSGRQVNGRRIGRFGYGEGVFVDSAERGNLDSEDERRVQGAVRNLPSDWLNPNNAGSLGWQGPYYTPVAPLLRLRHDGFEITRDSRSRQRFWRQPTGAASNFSTVRFRLRSIAGQTYIMNSVTAPGLIGQAAGSLSDADFAANAEQFNGVLYFAGDVRVRGVIPTDQQVSVVSMGSIYIDGSITKGILGEGGSVLNRPSTSALALLARDYAVVNTTQFFGPAIGQNPSPKSGVPIPDVPSPLELDPSSSPALTLLMEFLNGPDVAGADPLRPDTWRPYGSTYVTGQQGLLPHLITSASADDNGPAFVSFDTAPLNALDPSAAVFANLAVPRQLDFGGAGTVAYNAADPWFPASPTLPIYGLGNPVINAFPKFESLAFPLLSAPVSDSATNMTGASSRLAVNDPSLVRVRMNPVGTAPVKNFLLARAAVVPHDIRIEAAIFAEEGSFFVIPGSWFNTNADDSRARFLADLSALGRDEANLRRYQLFGSAPEAPFYGEPLSVRVRIIGSIAQNMPAPMSQQAEWKLKWGWMPQEIGSTGRTIPRGHVPAGFDSAPFVPNLTINYDPVFAFGTADGANPVRSHRDGWILPPMPRLPVSPTLAYFGDAKP